MPSLNRVHLIGNLTRDPVLKATSNGTQVCDFGLAMNSRYRTPDGVERENAVFVETVIYGKAAASCARCLKKGAPAYVEGRLVNSEWTDRSGAKHSRLKVRGERVLFLDSRSNAMQDVESGVDSREFALAGMGASAVPGAPVPPVAYSAGGAAPLPPQYR